MGQVSPDVKMVVKLATERLVPIERIRTPIVATSMTVAIVMNSRSLNCQ